MKAPSRSVPVSVKSGSISLASARQAARAVKAGRHGRSIGSIARSVPDSFKERYLGHFGVSSNHAGKSQPASRRPSVRKSSVKKTVAKKASGKTTAR